MVNNEFKISKNAKIKVEWNDKPENYIKEQKTFIVNYFSKKYGVDKANIKVEFNPIKIDKDGKVIKLNGAKIENIMDTNYQRELMKEWLKRENTNLTKENEEMLFKLDEEINSELNIKENDVNKKWEIKWVSVDNFLSFGEENYINFDKTKGLTVVNSEPKNTGGKSTITIDAIKFLLYGNTTKSDKNEEVFNRFTDKNETSVRGKLIIDNEEYIIERKLRRAPKKGGGWTVTNRVNYYKILPDNSEKLLNEEDAIRTTKKIRTTIGDEKDFELLILATERNLDDLIGLTSTESGKLLTRLIGLEPIEQKELLCREKYNSFNKVKKSNEYDIISLQTEIDEHKVKIDGLVEFIKETETKIEESKRETERLNNEKDRLIGSKHVIDVQISSMNPSKIETEINELTQKGVSLKTKTQTIENRIKEIGEISFDDLNYDNLYKNKNNLMVSIGLKKSEISNLNNSIDLLIKNGVCVSCNRKLDNVDNTEHINEKKRLIKSIELNLNKNNDELELLTNELESLSNDKKLVDEKNKLEIERDRVEVEISSLRNLVISKKDDLKKYKANLDSIEYNKKVDIDISIIKTNINVSQVKTETLTNNLQKFNYEKIKNEDEIVRKNEIINIINKENKKEIIYKLYIDIYGKRGISKLVLRSVLPIINSELERLMDGVCEFETEVFIDDKNDVQFLMHKDGVTNYLKSGSGFEKTASSLALRSVIGKLSNLPMPNFITFDEVLGKVANDNLSNLKPLFEKISKMYDIVILITHNDMVKDWAKNVVTVVKENNISKVKIS